MRRSPRNLGILFTAALGATSLLLFRAGTPVQADGVLGLNFACTDGELVVSSGNPVIDLGLAANAAWDAPSSGNGVYDGEKWAVVFKYSSVRISIGRTLRFENHPSRAPLIWLVEGDVIIDGTLDLRGENNRSAYTGPGEPGPGGFRGGYGQSEVSGPSAGFGPGGAGAQSVIGTPSARASGGSHATLGPSGNPDDPANVPGPTYGNLRVLPLLGGSGGAAFAHNFPIRQSGGGGGGAILIVAGGSIVVNGTIDCSGGGTSGFSSGGGSGGAIRLLAPVVSGGGRLVAIGGLTLPGRAGEGRIHIEADSIDLAQPGEPNFTAEPLEDPPMVFPPASAPRIRVASVGGLATPGDPHAGFPFADVTLSTTDPVTVKLEAENLPLDSTVRVRFVPRSGQDTWVDAFLDPGATSTFAQSTWTIAPRMLPDGFSTVQARAELPGA